MYCHVRSSRVDVWKQSSSGGAVRTIIKSLLGRGVVGQAVMTCSKGLGAETVVVEKPSDRIPATCYSYNSSLIPRFLSLPKETKKIAVALPCQARVIRNIDSSALIISPVCFQTVREEAIAKSLYNCGLHVESSEIGSLYRIHDQLVIETSNKSIALSFRDFWKHLRFRLFCNPQCTECEDHLSTSADIVAFDDNHRSNILLVRTIQGMKALACSADDMKFEHDRLWRLRLAVRNEILRYHVAVFLGKTIYFQKG